MNLREQADRYADIVATYLSRLTENELIEAVRDVSRENMNVIFQSAMKLEYYEVCMSLQKAASLIFV